MQQTASSKSVQVILKEKVTELFEWVKLLPENSSLRGFYINKVALLLLSKLLLPEMIFNVFLVAPSASDFAQFFAQCSFKQKHYLITHLLQSPSDWVSALLYQQAISLDQEVLEAQLRMILFAWVVTRTRNEAQANQKLTYSLHAAFQTYLTRSSLLQWSLTSPQLVRECYLLLSIKEDLIIENPAILIENADIFPALLNLYLLSLVPSQSAMMNVMQVVEAMAGRELKQYRIEQHRMRDWIQQNGL